METITWLKNLLHLHERMMARFLRKRSWVVFYLERQHRKCNGICWLELYELEEKIKMQKKNNKD